MVMRRFFFLIFLPLCWVSCVYHDTAVAPDNCSKSNLHVVLDSVRSATSCTIRDGGIYISVSGGIPPYSFYLNDVAASGGSFENLGPGIYSVTVFDFKGCDTTLTNLSVPSDGVSFTAAIQEDRRCLGNDGAVTIEIIEGNPPYQFSIDGGPFNDTNTFTGLSHGEHRVEVKDNDACVISLNVNVPRGQTGVSWSNDIRPIMETYCAVSGCHNGTSRSNDFRKYSSVRFYSKSIRSKTQERSMPFDRSLTQDQIDIIACWIDDGMPEN